jgi:hypothetical protein
MVITTSFKDRRVYCVMDYGYSGSDRVISAFFSKEACDRYWKAIIKEYEDEEDVKITSNEILWNNKSWLTIRRQTLLLSELNDVFHLHAKMRRFGMYLLPKKYSLE